MGKEKAALILKKIGSKHFVAEVMSYYSEVDVFALHSVCDEDHGICDNCFDILKNRALSYDTNMITCPACPRVLFISS